MDRMARYEITVEVGFAAAHNLRTYKGGCETLHGHNYKAEITIGCDALDGDGMVYDFKDLKWNTPFPAELFALQLPPGTETRLIDLGGDAKSQSRN